MTKEDREFLDIPEKFEKAMAEVIKKLLSTLPDIQ